MHTTERSFSPYRLPLEAMEATQHPHNVSGRQTGNVEEKSRYFILSIYVQFLLGSFAESSWLLRMLTNRCISPIWLVEEIQDERMRWESERKNKERLRISKSREVDLHETRYLLRDQEDHVTYFG